YLYLGFKRVLTSSTGSSNADESFEFNQQLPAFKPAAPVCELQQLSANPNFTGSCNRWRSPGDLLILYDFGGNSTACNTPSPDICVAVWATSSTTPAFTAPNTCFSAKAFPCWANAEPLESANKANGSISTDKTFGEASVDLTAAGVLSSGCEIFGSQWAE